MKLKTIILLLFFPLFSYSQVLCDSLSIDFPTFIETETHFLTAGDTIFTQDTFFVETGTYSFYYQSMTENCDSLVQVSVYPPEVSDNFMYLEDTVYLSGTGCGNENLVHCFHFQSRVHEGANCTFNGIDYGMISDSRSCFSLPLFGFHPSYDFVFSTANYPLKILAVEIDWGESVPYDFYVNSPTEFLHKIRALIPDVRIWLDASGTIRIGDDLINPDNFFSIKLTFKDANEDEMIINIVSGLIVDELISTMSIPSVVLSLQQGENILEIHDPTTNENKTIVFYYDYTLPETQEDYYTYSMPLGQTAVFPLSSDDLCEEIALIANICPELAENGAVDFSLQNDQTVKFRADTIGTSTACYQMCEQSGRCDTFTLSVEVYVPEIETEEPEPMPEDSLVIHNLYPNPASSTVHLTEPLDVFIKKITVYNSAGKLIDIVRLRETNSYELDVSRYAEGLYIVVRHLESGEIFVEKFVVQR